MTSSEDRERGRSLHLCTLPSELGPLSHISYEDLKAERHFSFFEELALFFSLSSLRVPETLRKDLFLLCHIYFEEFFSILLVTWYSEVKMTLYRLLFVLNN